MNTSRVFVVHENLSMNFSDAERFGEVSFVTNREWNPRRGSLSNGETFRQIRVALQTFDLERDFVILNGPPVLIGFAFHVLMDRAAICGGAAGIRVLSWDKRSNKYIEGLAETV